MQLKQKAKEYVGVFCGSAVVSAVGQKQTHAPNVTVHHHNKKTDIKHFHVKAGAHSSRVVHVNKTK